MANWMRRLGSTIAWRWRCQWAVLTAGRRTRKALASGVPRTLLVVCYGNIYRSPYAAQMLRHRLSALTEVRSSGFHHVVNRPSPAEHVRTSLVNGVDLSDHRSSGVTSADVDWADVIVLMDRHNWRALRQLGADPARLVWLGALDGGAEIADPYGVPPEEVRRIMQRLHRCSEALADAILRRKESSAR